jgi:hypothetical protein
MSHVKGAYRDAEVVYHTVVQGGSNMTGTNCDLFTHK